MKNSILLLTVIFLLSISISAQDIDTDKKNSSNKQKIEKVQAPLAVTDEIKFKNETGNPIITITDEGSNKGSITLPEMSSSPSTTLNKLYNLSGDLIFNGLPLSGAQQINNLADAKYDGSNLFIGESSGNSNDGSYNNLGVGKQALYKNSIGSENTAIGYFSLINNINGNGNTAIGNSAMYNQTNGLQNTAVGSESLHNNVDGHFNIAIGGNSLNMNVDGHGNTAVGAYALNKNLGSGNVALGRYAGFNSTVTNNRLYIENSSSSTPLIGGNFASDEIYLNGKVGIGTQTSTHELHVFSDSFSEIALFENKTAIDPDGIIVRAGPDVNPTNDVDYLMFQDGDGDNIGTIDGNGSGGVNYNTTSDARLKTKIEEYQNAIEVVSQIGIKKYERLSNPGVKEIGLLAQELKNVYPQAVSGSPNSDVKIDPMMVDYSKLTPLLVKAMQEQQEMISNQGELIEELKNEIDELKRR